MAVETVTNYKCDRCGRSEIIDHVEIMTLTVRKRTSGTPGQGQAVITQHVCAQNCLKMIKAAMAPVGRAGRPKGSTNGGTKPVAAPVEPTTTTTSKGGTKRGTKKAQAPVSRKITTPPTSNPQSDPFNALPAHVRAVRVKTRTPQGGFAPGYNYRKEAKMIKEAEAKINSK